MSAATRSRIRDTVDMLMSPWFPLYRDLTVNPVDLTGKNAIVTGANIGIGFECARKLAQMNANVTLACRSAGKGEAAKKELVESTGNKNVQVALLDTSSFASVKEFVNEWGSKPVDILINNAGMTASHYLKTDDGIEASFQINFMSHFLLTSLLLPSLQPQARIVNVASIGHYTGQMQPEDVDRSLFLERGVKVAVGDVLDAQTFLGIYADAKLSQVAFSRELQTRLDASPAFQSKKIIVSSCHPGLVASSIFDRNVGKSTHADVFIQKVKPFVSRLGSEFGRS
ncbi:hypothetical protein P7C70_g5690, partial [Phenoliferia sp. Uapishka_3]